MKLVVLSLLLLGIIAVIDAATPTRPVISNVFHASVSVEVKQGNQSFSGGGIYSYDTKNNRARTDYRLEANHQRDHWMYIHILLRYDLHAQYVIEGQEKCTKHSVQGQLPNPWAFVAKAEYIGTNTFRGHKYDEWEQKDSNTSYTRLAVRSDDTTKPVFILHHEVVDGEVREQDILFEEFDDREPAEWVFYVPKACENSTTAPVSALGGPHQSGGISPDGPSSRGDVNAVVYFANANWNCADVACRQRVPAGHSQPAYQCAEFTARALAHGGFIPGLHSDASQREYMNYKGHNLCLVTELATALEGLKFRNEKSVGAAYAVMGNGGDGAMSHACIGVSGGHLDCHNNARKDEPVGSIMVGGVQKILAP